MSISHIKKNRTLNIFMISVVSLGIGFYGFDSAFLHNDLGDEHLGDRSLSRKQMTHFVNGYLEQYNINQNHPNYENLALTLSNQFKDNWRKTTKIALMLENEGFEPNFTQIKAAINIEDLTESELEKLAMSNGLTPVQFVYQASDEWRRSTFATLLKQSEIIDSFSAQVESAIKNQTRVFKRYQLNLPASSVTDSEINVVYEKKSQDYQFPKTYQVNALTIQGKDLVALPSIESAKQYFMAHRSQKPLGEVVSLIIIKKVTDGALKKEDLKPMTTDEKNQIIHLMDEGYSVYEHEHPFADGLIQQDDYYSFKNTLEPEESVLISHYHSILMDQALEKVVQTHKELVFTSHDLTPVANALNLPVTHQTFTLDQMDASWPKEKVIEYIEGSDSLKYNSAFIPTSHQSLIVLKLKNIQPAKQKTLAEASADIKQMLLSTKEENNRQHFSLNLMQALGKGPLPQDLANQVIESELTIHFNDLPNYQFIQPIQQAFFIYQTNTDQHPTFLVNHSVAQLDSITYPDLNESNSAPPGYLSSSLGLLGALNS